MIASLSLHDDIRFMKFVILGVIGYYSRSEARRKKQKGG